jgi:cellulose synthase/poly-beta-1,6-N-acetylglucosamine synthase-like glycosyltransferase
MYFIGFIITAVLLAVYCILILIYRYWFRRLPVFELSKDIQPQHRFSVIIPARNEAAIISSCLLSVLQQNYPSELFEVIVINDHSTDDTESIIRGLQTDHPNLVLINLADHLNGELNSYKKKAIEIGIAQSKGDWIVTTDADCFAQPNWLRSIDGMIQQQQPVFVAAPVMFTNDGHLLSVFQVLDFISLQGITAASVSAGYHTMCNGANIAYKKEAFYHVGGFKNIDQLASGDDMLLMHKIKQAYPNGIAYLFSQQAIISTEPMHNWKSFLNQRIRWASKADKYRDRSIFWVLLLVYLTNLGLLLLLLVGPFVEKGFQQWLLLVLIKTLAEMSFMVPVGRFYQQEGTLGWFPMMQPFHILYTVIAGWLGKFGSYQWKGRKVH